MKNVNGPTPYGDHVSRVILDSYLRIGDRVEMATRWDDEGWHPRKVVNGVQGTVIGFKRYKRHQSRVGVYKEQPGLWESNGAAVVRWDTGVYDTPDMHSCVFVDASLREDFRNRPGQKEWRDAFDQKEFVAELPQLPLWEGDFVTFIDKDSSWYGAKVRIENIDYDNIGRLCNDGKTPLPIYRITPADGSGGSMTVRESSLMGCKRGNVWWWYNDKSQLKFTDLADEVRFHTSLGLTQEVKNPVTGDYHWPVSDVLPAAKEGLIDVIRSSAGFFGSGPSMRGVKILDKDLSAKCNALLVSGFTYTA